MNAVGFLAKWFFILGWRFFTGAHMNGKTYNDATWWRDSSTRYRNRRNAYTWWRRKARLKRATWRACIYMPTALLILGFIWSTSSMEIGLLALAPFLAYVVFGRVRILLFQPYTTLATDGSGALDQHWMLKPKIRKRFRKKHRPGIATSLERSHKPKLVEIPPDKKRAVVHELREELDGELPIEMKLLMAPDDGEP